MRGAFLSGSWSRCPWLLGVTLAAWLLAPGAVRAQNFAVDRSVLGGGGGTSTNGQFSVTGIIGQPAAAPASTGGNFALTSGFWSVAIALQTPGAPTLRVTCTGNQVVIAWPADAAGFVLEVTEQLRATAGATVWQAEAATPVVVSNELCVTLPVQPGVRFFRLKKVGP